MVEKIKDESQENSNSHGYIVFILALTIGLLINISASIIYDMFLKDNLTAEYIVLGLTLIAFLGLIYVYHSRLHEPLAKFLREFE